MIRDPRSNPLALAVLVCLFEKPMHPYEIAQTLRLRHKHESMRLNYGSLYSVVKSLERANLIRPVGTSREGRRPKRTVYEIMEPGRVEMRSWLSELVATPVKEYLQFEAALALLAALPPESALSLLKRRCVALEHRLEEGETGLDQVRQDFALPRLFLVEADYMFTLLRAELEWTRSLVEEIETGTLDGMDLWEDIHATETAQGRGAKPGDATGTSHTKEKDT